MRRGRTVIVRLKLTKCTISMLALQQAGFVSQMSWQHLTKKYYLIGASIVLVDMEMLVVGTGYIWNYNS